jgi:thiol-disulfide isomerase/thioredoxin
MKKLLLATLLLGMFLTSQARHGYKIEISFKQDIPDTFVYLAHYFAKSLPTIYKTDSAKVINKRTAVFNSKDSVLGGIYLVLFKNNSRYIEFVLNNGDQMSIDIDTTNLPASMTFKNSPENTRYVSYGTYLLEFGKLQQQLNEELKSAKNAADSQAIREKGAEAGKKLNAYRRDYAQTYKGTYLASVFDALEVPQVPEGPHYLPGTNTIDSNFAYEYYKAHYWDKFDFSDNRLINSPIYDARLDEYFNRLVLPLPDTMKAEADWLLAKSRKASELFKYTLHWLARNAEGSKVMGMDEVFVHLVEKYYMKGDAFWLDSAALAKYEDRAKKIAPNVLGNIAPDLVMQDVYTLKDRPLSSISSPYTLLVFWAEDCSHCVKEVPLLDSVYKANLKDRGVTIYAVATKGGDLSDKHKMIEKLNLKHWTNVMDMNNTTDYKSKYDVYSTPKIYLLDANKKIIGKGLDHGNIGEVIDWVEKKNRKNQ